MTKSRRIIVIDDHPLCAAAVSAAVSKLGIPLRVETAGALREVATICAGDDVALVFLDLRLPDAVGLSGVETVRATLPTVPICILSGQTDVGTMRQALAMDVAGFLPKTLAFDALARAIAELLQGKRVFPPMHASEEERVGTLSPAETRIMQMLSLGLQNKQIAFELSLSESTVKSHLVRIFEKLKVSNRSQAIMSYDRLVNEAGGVAPYSRSSSFA